MKKEYYFLVDDVAMGPYSAEEMLSFDLHEKTPVTDDIDGEKWKTAGSFDFSNYAEEAEHKNEDLGSLRLKGGTYLFYYKLNGKDYGPRSATKMLQENLPHDTPVTEASLNGLWGTVVDFDFQSLSQDEQTVQYVGRNVSNRTAVSGLIWLVVGLVITYVSYQNAAGGGTYFIAFGAIIWGFINLVRGLLGGGDIPEGTFSYEKSENPHSEGNTEIGVSGFSTEKINEQYAKLNLTPNATDREVKEAYREMAKRWHPDRFAKDTESVKQDAAAHFRNIKDAYEFIKRLRNIK